MSPVVCPQHFADRGWTRRGKAPKRMRDTRRFGMVGAPLECWKAMMIATRHLSGMPRQAIRAQA